MNGKRTLLVVCKVNCYSHNIALKSMKRMHKVLITQKRDERFVAHFTKSFDAGKVHSTSDNGEVFESRKNL